MRASAALELANPVLAFAVVAVAALAGSPAVLVLMAPLWLLPDFAAERGLRGLDEREGEIRDRSERRALRAMFLIACASPLLGGARADNALSLLQQEWADGGMLLVAAFVVRALGFAAGALSPAAAAHYAGGVATSMTLAWLGALAVARPPFAPLLLVIASLPLLPHATARAWPRLAGGLWIAGAGATVVHAIGTGMIPIEITVVIILIALPWGTAGWWSLRPDAV